MWGGMRSRLSARMSLRRQPEWQRRHIPAAARSSQRFFSDEPARRSQRAYDLAQEMFAEGRISAELLESVAIATADGRSDDGPVAGPDTAATSIACSGAEADLDLGSGDLWYRPSVPSHSEQPMLPRALRAAAEGGHVTATERALIAGQDPNHASDSVGTTQDDKMILERARVLFRYFATAVTCVGQMYTIDNSPVDAQFASDDYVVDR